MKETGMVRPIDKLGRVVIPKELRRMMNVQNDHDSFEIFVDGDALVLKKYRPHCVFCGSEENCVTYNNMLVCAACIDNLADIKEKGDGSNQIH